MEEFEIVWLVNAINDVSEHISFIMTVNVDSALELRNHIKEAVDGLKKFPERHPLFDMPKSFPVEVRKAVIEKRYLFIYTIEAGQIIIYRVLDARKGFEYII